MVDEPGTGLVGHGLKRARLFEHLAPVGGLVGRQQIEQQGGPPMQMQMQKLGDALVAPTPPVAAAAAAVRKHHQPFDRRDELDAAGQAQGPNGPKGPIRTCSCTMSTALPHAADRPPIGHQDFMM